MRIRIQEVAACSARLSRLSTQVCCLQVMKNAVLPPSKRSTVERQMDLVILFMFAMLFAMCIANAACFAVWTQANAPLLLPHCLCHAAAPAICH